MTLILAVSFLPLLLMLVYRYPQAVLWSFPLLWLFTVFNPFYPFRAGSFALLPMDAAYFLATAYIGMYFFRHPKQAIAALKENRFFTLFLALMALSVVIYTPIYGQSAIGELRKYYGFFVFPLFALVVLKKPEDFHRFILVIVATAGVVALAAFARTAAGGSFLRVVNAQGTLMMAFAAFALIVLRMNKVVLFHPKVDKILLAVFAALALGSGQRSAWLAVGAGSLFLVWLQYGRPMLMAKIGALVLAVFVAAATSLVYFPDVGERVAARFSGIINPMEDRTASWRIEGWQQQIEYLRENSLFFGEGLGSYYKWDGYGIDDRTNPHNAYIQTTLKFGLLGLSIYGLLALQFFRRALAVRRKLPPGPTRAWVEMGILNFGAVHGYMLGYPFELSSIMYLGVAMGAMKMWRESVYASRLEKLRTVQTDSDLIPRQYRGPRPQAAIRS